MRPAADDDMGFWTAGHGGLRELARERRAHYRATATGPQARFLRVYILWKLATEPGPPPRGLDELDALLIAAINAAAVRTLLELTETLRGGDGVQRRTLATLRERGKLALADHPGLDEPEPGLPRDLPLAVPPHLLLAGERVPEPEESEVAPAPSSGDAPVGIGMG
jgi:hypothetical protein